MKVLEWMVTEPVTVSPRTRVREAIRLMRQHSIRHLPVVEGSELIGLVTAGDLRELILPSMVEAIFLHEVMLTNPVTIGPDASIDAAAKLIYERKIGGLPVVEDRRLVGIITVTDILKAFIEIMGVLVSSSRIDVILASRPAAFEEVSRIIAGHGADVISVGINNQPGGDRVHFFRLSKCDTAPIARSLKQRGHRVAAAMD
ncbi:MAG: CBS domain-containing protein, partial [Pseudomonadota bacterium]